MKWTLGALAGALVVAVCLWVLPAIAMEEPPPAPPAPGAAVEPDLQQQIRQLRDQLKTVERDMDKIRKAHKEDADVVAAQKAMEDAKKAHDELMMQKVAADPAGPELLKKQQELNAQLDQLRAKYKEEMKTKLMEKMGEGGMK